MEKTMLIRLEELVINMVVLSFSLGIEMEPVDDSLETKLQELQAETDNILVEVTRYRKKYPQIAAKNYSLSLEKAINNVEAQLEQLSGPEMPNFTQDLPDGLLIDYSFKVEKLSQLQNSIPEILAKLQRARHVLKEEGARALKDAGIQETDENMTENLSELINSQRRITKQMDIASKIFQQF
jgi:hypothetical protein